MALNSISCLSSIRNILPVLGIVVILLFGETFASDDGSFRSHAHFRSTKSTGDAGVSEEIDLAVQTGHCRRNNLSKKMVVCYFRGGRSNFLPSEIDPCLCTHVVFSSVVITEDGIANSPDESAQLKTLVGLKVSNPLLSVLVSIVGVESALSGRNAANATFLAEIVASFVRQHELDGVDVWWNYQNVDIKQSTKYLSHSSSLLTNFTKSLKSAMRRELSADNVLSVTLAKDVHFLLNGYEFSSIMDDVDFFSFPAFQFTKSKSHIAGHPSRLQGAADMDNVDSFVDLMISLGIERTKIVIGIPTFGSAYLLVDPQHSSAGSPTRELHREHGVNSYPQILSYPQICSMISAGNWNVHRDVDDGSPYANRGVHWIGFEDRISIKTKTKFVLLRNLGGVSMWTVNDDDHKNVCRQGSLPLLRSAHDMLIALKSPFDAFNDTDVTLDSDESQQELRIVEREGLIQRLDSRNADPQTLMRFQCSRSGYFRDPKDCTKFYRCAKYGGKTSGESVIFLYDCPHGLVFDEKDELCNWPPWSSPCEGSGEVMPVPQRTFTCPSTGYYQDPENCRWFFFCADFGDGQTKAFEFRCPSALLGFDQQKVMCNWKWLVTGCPGVSVDIEEAPRTTDEGIASFPRKAVYVSSGSKDNEFHLPSSDNREAGNNRKQTAGHHSGDERADFVISSGLWGSENYYASEDYQRGIDTMLVDRPKHHELQYGDVNYDDDLGYSRYSSLSSKATSHVYNDQDRSYSSSILLPQKVESVDLLHNRYHSESDHRKIPMITNGLINGKELSFSNGSSTERNIESMHIKLSRQKSWSDGQTFEDVNYSLREKTDRPPGRNPFLAGATPQQFSKRAETDPAALLAEGVSHETPPYLMGKSNRLNNGGSISSETDRKHGVAEDTTNGTQTFNKVVSESNVNQVLNEKGRKTVTTTQEQQAVQTDVEYLGNIQSQTIPFVRSSSSGEAESLNLTSKAEAPLNIPDHKVNKPFEMVLEAVLMLRDDESRVSESKKQSSNSAVRQSSNKISGRLSSFLPATPVGNRNSQKLSGEKDHLQCLSEVSLVISGKGRSGNFPEKWILKNSQLKRRTGQDDEAKSPASERDDTLLKSRISSEQTNGLRVYNANHSDNLLLSGEKREPQSQSSVQYSEETQNPLTKEFSFSFINSTYIGDFSLSPKLEYEAKSKTGISRDDDADQEHVQTQSNSTGEDFEDRVKSSSFSSRGNTLMSSGEEAYDEKRGELPRNETSSTVSSPNVPLRYQKLTLSEAPDEEHNSRFFSASGHNVSSLRESKSPSLPTLQGEKNYTTSSSGEPSIIKSYKLSENEPLNRNSEIVRTKTVVLRNSSAHPRTEPKEILSSADDTGSNAQSGETVTENSKSSTAKLVNGGTSGILLEVEHGKRDYLYQDVLYEVYEREIKSEGENDQKGVKVLGNATLLTQRSDEKFNVGQARKVPSGNTASVVFDRKRDFQERRRGSSNSDQSGRNTSSRTLVDKHVTAQLEIKATSPNLKHRQSSVTYAEQSENENDRDSGYSSSFESLKERHSTNVTTSDGVTNKELHLKNPTFPLLHDRGLTVDNGTSRKGNSPSKVGQGPGPFAINYEQAVSLHLNRSSARLPKTNERGPSERRSQRRFTQRTEVNYDDKLSELHKEDVENRARLGNNHPIPANIGLVSGDSLGNRRTFLEESNLKFGERLRPLLNAVANINISQISSRRYRSQKPPKQYVLSTQRDSNHHRSLQNEPKPLTRHEQKSIRIAPSHSLPTENPTRRSQRHRTEAEKEHDQNVAFNGDGHYYRNAGNYESTKITNPTKTEPRRYAYVHNVNHGQQRARNISRRRNATQTRSSNNDNKVDNLANNGNIGDPFDNHFRISRTDGRLPDESSANYPHGQKYNSEAVRSNSKDVDSATHAEEEVIGRYDAKRVLNKLALNSSQSYDDTPMIGGKNDERNSFFAGLQSRYGEAESGDILEQRYAGPLRRYVFPISPNAFKYPQRNDLYISDKRNPPQTAPYRPAIDMPDESSRRNNTTDGANAPGVTKTLNFSSALPHHASNSNSPRTPRVLNSLSTSNQHATGQAEQSNSPRRNSSALPENDPQIRFLQNDRTQVGHVQFDYSDGDKLNSYLRIGTFLIFPNDEYDNRDPREFPALPGNPGTTDAVNRIGESQISGDSSTSANPSTTGENMDHKIVFSDKNDTSFRLRKNDIDENTRILQAKDNVGTNIPGVACTRAGLFYHPDDCNKFYQCYWDRWLQKFTLHIFKCPVRLVFDDRIFGCSYPEWEAPCLNSVKSESVES